MTTKERLRTALEAAGAPRYMLDNAARGVYDDYESPLAMPQHQLHADALAEGLANIAAAVERGEFDGTKEESDAWAKSADGKAAFEELTAPPKQKGMRVRLEDDSFVDRIVIETIPRFKTSGLSGDEWRHHVQITAYRKGRVVAERHVGNLDYATRFLATNDWWTEHEAIPNPAIAEDLCDQPGCAEPWTVLYRIKSRGCGHCGARERYAGDDTHAYLRAFCDKHKTRGDSDLDDMDDLYEFVGASR